MFDTIIAALLPIVITLLLGMVAGWHKDFEPGQAALLNRTVMLYALPMSLFSGMVQTPRQELLSDLWLFFLVAVVMVGGFFLTFFVIRNIFKRPQGVAVLQALAISGPAVPFVGVPVLGYLYGAQSSIVVAVAGILMNLIQVPFCLVILAMAQSEGNAGQNGHKQADLGRHIRTAVKEPVVWAPFLALIFILLNIHFPKALSDALTLLGKATGGVALFASGIVLFSQKVTLSKAVAVSVLCRNIVVPLILLMLALLLNIPKMQATEAVIAMAIPVASITVILAVQFKTAEREMASTLFLSTLLSVVTMGGFIALTA